MGLINLTNSTKPPIQTMQARQTMILACQLFFLKIHDCMVQWFICNNCMDKRLRLERSVCYLLAEVIQILLTFLIPNFQDSLPQTWHLSIMRNYNLSFLFLFPSDYLEDFFPDKEPKLYPKDDPFKKYKQRLLVETLGSAVSNKWLKKKWVIGVLSWKGRELWLFYSWISQCILIGHLQ